MNEVTIYTQSNFVYRQLLKTASVKSRCIYVEERIVHTRQRKQMKLQRKVKLLAIPAILINSMLIGMGTAQANSSRGFTQTCTDVDYEAGVLSATCRTIQGENQRSSINLGNSVTESDCTIPSATPYGSSPQTPQTHLSCNVRTRDGQVAHELVTLDDFIENVDGQLQFYE